MGLIGKAPRWDTYKKAIESIPLEISHPTEEDFILFFPHLTKWQVIDGLEGKNGIASPPLRIDGAYMRIWGKYHNDILKLTLAYNCRTPESYADSKGHGSVFDYTPYQKEAIEYARNNWGDRISRDPGWEDILQIHLQDPSDLYDAGYGGKKFATEKAILYVMLNRGYDDLINDHSRPKSKQFDDAIGEMTLDKTIMQELKGGRGGYTNFSCANCGQGLRICFCPGCGLQFDDNIANGGGGDLLSPKMVAFLREHGFVFKKDPAVYWKNER